MSVSMMNLNFRRFDLKLTDTWRVSSGQGVGQAKDLQQVMLVQLHATGFSGIGEGAPSNRYRESVETVEAFLRKVDPSRLSFQLIPESMRYLDSLALGNYTAKAALNIALVDGVAKAARQPVCDYLKLGFQEKRHLTSFSIGIDHPDVIRKKVARAAAYPILKLKVGSLDDAANLRAVRDLAPDKTLRVDANEAWTTREEALEKLEWLAQDKRIEFVEQPMPCDSNPNDMAWLKERSPLPLFGDESYHQASDVSRCGECFYGVNGKFVKTGCVSP